MQVDTSSCSDLIADEQQRETAKNGDMSRRDSRNHPSASWRADRVPDSGAGQSSNK